MAVYHKPILLADSSVQICVLLDLKQIQDLAAAVANKVTVGLCHPVIPGLAIDHSHALNLSLGLEKG